MRIPIVFATDTNYLFYTCVAITSMAQSADKDTIYQVYILIGMEFFDKENLLGKLQQKYKNIHIEMIVVDGRLFEDVVIHHSHVTKVTFYRLALCELIEEEKCIYLDADIIVKEDLTELYETELDGCYIAGCRDIWIDLMPDKVREQRRRKTGVPSMDQYVNAGVLLFDLKQIRKDGMEKVFKEHLSRAYLFEDQDILNVCCYGRILFLPAKWNLFTLFMGKIQAMRDVGIGEQILKDFMQKQGIIHYATPFIRPWEKEVFWENWEWWQVAQEWRDERIYKEVRGKVSMNEWKSSWDFYEEMCTSCDQVVIFGYTKYGEELLGWIKKIKKHVRVVFGDNNLKKQGIIYNDTPVLSFQKIMHESVQRGEKNLLFIIASRFRSQEIREFLLNQGIEERQIICYRKKDEDYYSWVDERNYMYEWQDICKREGVKDKEILSSKPSELRNKLLGDSKYQGWKEQYFMQNWLLKEEGLDGRNISACTSI